MAQTILLIGASGFAGGHFHRLVESAGFEVVTAGRHSEDFAVDLLRPETVTAAVSETEPEIVVNLAGSASVGASFGDPGGAFAVNALGVVHLLAAVAEECSNAYVLCVSSGEIYGEADELPLVEESELRPVSPYGASKAAMEVACAQAARSDGLRIGIVRAFNHTGPGQSDAFAASSFARQIAEGERDGGEAVLRTGNLDVERDFTDVRDIASAYLTICERELVGTYNACSGQPIPIRRIVEELADVSSVPVRVETDPARVREGEPPTIYGSAERLREETGWEPAIDLQRTTADLLEWWRARVNRGG